MFIRVCGGRKKSEKFVSTKGTISVTTNVSGASITIKDITSGSSIVETAIIEGTSFTTKNKLAPGKYEIEVSKKGYDTYRTTIDLKGDETVNAILTESIKTGAIATVENSLVEYTDTVLVNDNAIVTVTVKDKSGNIVPGKAVVFSINQIYGSADLEVKGQNVQTTNADGKVSFVVGLKNSTTNSTDRSKVASAKYTAKVLDVADGTESIATGCVGFAALSLAGISNITATDKLATGENAKEAGYESGKAKTYSLNEDTTEDVEYISTQKVSTDGKDEHEVTFSANPKIVLPTMLTEDKKAEEFVQPVNYKSGDYFTYADGKYDKIIVLEEEASNLLYATLMFNDIKVSKYTRIVIDSYKDEACKSKIDGTTYVIDGEHTQKNFGYQLPLNQNVKAVKVSIESAGQVETDMNSGYDIKEIVGVYKNSTGTLETEKTISSANITWETVDPTMSNFVDLTAEKVIALGITPKDTAGKNTFKYQVPVFPNTGDAVIKEFDVNGNVVSYYLVPTIKDTTTYKNTNIIKPGAKAYEATAEEATNHKVGTIKAEGNSVKVNSNKVGSTNIKGTISLPSLGGDVLDASNKYIYTSVQWNPIPKDSSTSDAFLALAGQNINVYAQLVDKNGNPVSLKDQPITYTYTKAESAEVDQIVSGANKDRIDNIAVVKNTVTDVNGKATLTLNSAQAYVLNDLKASSGAYDVILYIGSEKASLADLYWVNADLAFKKDVKSADYDVRTNNDTKKFDTDKPVVSTPWQYAVRTVGNTFVTTGSSVGLKSYEKNFKKSGILKDYDITIDGLKINTTFDEDNKGTYKVVGNGVVDATSNREYKDRIITELNNTSVGNDVTFTAKKNGISKTYKCVGEGSANLTAKLNLDVSWEAKGQMLSITSPAGTTISKDAGNTTGKVDLYVKVTDATGNNPKEGTTVTFKSGTSTDTFTYDNGSSAVTDGNGVAHVVLNLNDANGVNSTKAQKSSVITASVSGVDQVATTTINWVNKGNDFGLVNAGVSSTDTKQLVLTFNNNVEAASVKTDMFEVKNVTDSKKYEVTDAKASGRYVYLTLKNVLPADEYEVSVAPTKIDSIKYALCDDKGVAVGTNGTTTINFYSEKTGKFEAVVDYKDSVDKATIKISDIKSGIELSDLVGTNGIDNVDVLAYAKKYFKVTVDGKIQADTVFTNAKDSDDTIKNASFDIVIPQDADEQKVAIYFLGGYETYTVASYHDTELVNYTIDDSKNITLEFNRNIDEADGITPKDIIKCVKASDGKDNVVSLVGDMNGSSKKVTITLTDAIAEGDVLTVPAKTYKSTVNGTTKYNSEVKIKIDLTSPVTAASDVTVNKVSDTKFTLVFKEALDNTTLDTGIVFTDNDGGGVTASYELGSDGKTVTATLSSNVGESDTFKITTSLKDIHGNAATAVAPIYTFTA